MPDVYGLSPEPGDPLKMSADLMGLFEALHVHTVAKKGSEWLCSGLAATVDKSAGHNAQLEAETRVRK